jgi:hypothetical protein
VAIVARAYKVQKSGNTVDEYEDASNYQEFPDRAVFHAAVADGATETSFSREWAQLLVNAYCDGRFESGYHNEIAKLQRRWRLTLRDRQLPWYAEEKLKLGAYSSLVGITLFEEETPNGLIIRFTALAVGDSCLFHFRDDRLLLAWPLNRADQFGSRPVLLPSISPHDTSLSELVGNVAGNCQRGDRIFLMTDALACWLLQSLGATGELRGAIRDFVEINVSEKFIEQIDRLRSHGLIRNDDVTIVQISLD